MQAGALRFVSPMLSHMLTHLELVIGTLIERALPLNPLLSKWSLPCP